MPKRSCPSATKISYNKFPRMGIYYYTGILSSKEFHTQGEIEVIFENLFPAITNMSFSEKCDYMGVYWRGG